MKQRQQQGPVHLNRQCLVEMSSQQVETFSNSRIHVGCVRRLMDDAFLDGKQAIHFTDQQIEQHRPEISPEPGLCDSTGPLELNSCITLSRLNSAS